MIRLIEALNFRCLRYIRQELSDFHVLVGPNGSGKTSFLEVPTFLAQLCHGVNWTLLTELLGGTRSSRAGLSNMIEWAVEMEIPRERRQLLTNQKFDLVRYEASVAVDPSSSENGILSEKILLRESPKKPQAPLQITLFPRFGRAPETIITPKGVGKTRIVVDRVPDGSSVFYAETGKGRGLSFRFGPRQSALQNLPDDETKYPVATWLKKVLRDGVRKIDLDLGRMQRASSPAFRDDFLSLDGSNLPWVIESLMEKHPQSFESWLDHVRSAVPDIRTVETVLTPDSGFLHLVVSYENDVKVPAWMVSAGTLSLMALTIIPYIPDFRGVWLIEEPENRIHPKGIETVFQSLSSVYGGQLLLATHSPLVVSLAEADQVLCFAKTPDGATDIIRGSEHPALRNWKGEENLGVLYAAGVLG